VDGLLHISKLGAGRRINHPREVLDAGQEITVRIDSIDPEKQRIALVPDDYAGTADQGRDSTPPRPKERPKFLGTLGDLLTTGMKKKK
jgi:small subunit ribosomal protein S1